MGAALAPLESATAFNDVAIPRNYIMPWLHAPISSSEVLSDVAEPSEV